VTDPAPATSASALGVLARMARILRADWPLLLVSGLAIFIPIGLLETIDANLQDAVEDTSSLTDVLEVLGVTLVHTAGSLLGAILFAGLVSTVATGEGLQRRLRLRTLAGRMDVGRLIEADLLLVLVVTVGLALLVVPGFIFLVWFALVGPALEVEDLGVRAAFRRSRELVRTRFWLVAGFVIPLNLLEGSLVELIQNASIWSLGENFAGDWLAGTASTLATSLLLALAATVLYLELSGTPGQGAAD
jgi:hypothetical protein